MLNKSRVGSTSPTTSSSLATTPALTYVPTPSPSPFSPMSELSFSLASDPKSLESPLYSAAASSNFAEFVPLDRSKLNSVVPEQNCNLVQQNNLCHPFSTGAQPQPMSSLPGQDVKLLLFSEPDPSGPASPCYSTTQPRFPAAAPLAVSTTAQSTHTNKKRRLLTFLAEQDPVQPLCSGNKSSQIILAPTTAKPDQIIFNPAKSDELLLNSTKPETLPLPVAASQAQQTLYFQPCINTCTPIEPVKPEQTTLIINQPAAQKPESTLIINSEGTAATLITPVVSGPSALPLLGQACITTTLTKETHSSTFTLTNSSPLTNYTLVPSPLLSVDFTQKQSVASTTAGHNLQQMQPMNYDQYYEQVMCFKCTVNKCGFLCLNITALKHHLIDDHDDLMLDADDENVNETSWLPDALKSGIQLSCPHKFCPNKFNSGRSFKVHMTEDHGLDETDAERELEIRNRQRKEQVMKARKEQKLKERDERRRRKRSYEAYVDSNNELRIRVPLKPSETNHKGKQSDPSDEEIDVLVDKNGLKNIKASDYLAFVYQNKDVTDNRKDKNSNSPKIVQKKRSKIGRPKGSSTIGISALRKINPSIKISDTEMGSLCDLVRKDIGIKMILLICCVQDECGVRLKDPENLRVHREAHHGSGFRCPRCGEVKPGWAAMSLHLWREHSLDLELLSCPVQDCQYRSASRARLARHQAAHTQARPWLCPLCGQAFKQAKQLRAHTATHNNKTSEDSLSCPHCSSSFTLQRHLKLHIDSVHNKIKPFLCSFCGYSSSSRSALKLHTRKHTGDRPFTCSECEYSSADHNSLRRHKMQHSGVRPYSCPYCPYTSIQSTTYKVHLKTKHAVEEVSNILFQCKLCVFKTLKESIYLAHLSQHSGDNNSSSEASSQV